MAKRSKKNKKELISFEKLRAFRKVFSAVFSIVIIFDVFTHIIVRAQTVSESLRDTAEKLARSKVIEEQVEHFAVTRAVARDCEKNAEAIEEFMQELENGGYLDQGQKMDLATELKGMEENSFALEARFNEYYGDATIQYNSQANGNITNYVYETSLLRIALERFSRRAEQQLLFGALDATEREILLEDYYDILWQIAHLKEIEKELRIFENLSK